MRLKRHSSRAHASALVGLFTTSMLSGCGGMSALFTGHDPVQGQMEIAGGRFTSVYRDRWSGEEYYYDNGTRFPVKNWKNCTVEKDVTKSP